MFPIRKGYNQNPRREEEGEIINVIEKIQWAVWRRGRTAKETMPATGGGTATAAPA